jgi:hypothetical protein
MHYWTGNNAICLSGRAMCGPVGETALGWSFFFVLAPTAVFSALVLPNLVRYCTAAVAVGEALLFIAVLATLLRAAFTEPGMLPRARPLPDDTADPPPAEVDIATTSGKFCGRMRICRTCLVYRSSRCSHCSLCDACVLDFDHHCPWIGNCVGRRNYRMFVAFLVAANVKCLYILALSVTNIILISTVDSQSLSQAIAATPASLVLAIFCLFILCTVGGLCSYHVSVMMDDTTTRMNLKHIARDPAEAAPEPGCANLWRRMCGHSFPSFLPNYPENWAPCSADSAAAALEAAYGPCDIDSIKRRVDLEGSNVVLTVSQMHVLFTHSNKSPQAEHAPATVQSTAPSTIAAQPPAVFPSGHFRHTPNSSTPNVPSTSPPLPACEEVDAITRCAPKLPVVCRVCWSRARRSCACRFDGAWYKAVIVQRFSNSSARVHFSGWGSEYSEVRSRLLLLDPPAPCHATACVSRDTVPACALLLLQLSFFSRVASAGYEKQ